MPPDEPKGWEASADAWIARIDHDANRKLLDPVALDLCGEVNGQLVLDMGCGEGRFCRALSAKGASTIGIDPTAGLIAEAHRRDPDGNYLRANAEALPFADNVFDLAILYLVLIDIPDYRTAIAEAARVLKPGGRLINVNLLAFRTALDSAWAKDAAGNRLHVMVDRYYEEQTHTAEWCGISIANYHRPAEAYFMAFLDAGLRLTAYREPRPTLDQVAETPSYESERRVPLFSVQAWEKPLTVPD